MVISKDFLILVVDFHADVSCYFGGDDVLYPFAFRTHTHTHGLFALLSHICCDNVASNVTC